MLSVPQCWKRRCKNYFGIIQPDYTEQTERNNCKAFPDGIPIGIAYGRNKHTRPLPDQKNDTVFESIKTK